MNESKVHIGLVNPKTPENVNSVMRAAGNFGVDHVSYTGTRYPRAVKLHPGMVDISRKVGKEIPLVSVNCLFDNLDKIASDINIVCVEFAENAIALPEYEHPQNAIYVFGPEDGSLTQDIINKADDVIYVPTNGCMNIAATVSVVLYDRLMKSSSTALDNNELIRSSRDINNTLIVSR